VKLHSDPQSGLNTITGYGLDYIMVNSQTYQHPILVSPEGPIENWFNLDFAALSSADFAPIANKKPEVVILGTGPQQHFPKPELMKLLIEAKIGFAKIAPRTNPSCMCTTARGISGCARAMLVKIWSIWG